jgi:hypothetical protein
MATEKQLNFIRHKAIEANPLARVGDRVRVEPLSDGAANDEPAEVLEINERGMVLRRGQLFTVGYLPDQVEVIGRSIGIADVLLALERFDEGDTAWRWKNHLVELVRSWNLRFDDLREQRDETVELVYSLLL